VFFRFVNVIVWKITRRTGNRFNHELKRKVRAPSD